MKTCSRCGETKPLDDFNRNSGTKDGRHAYCRQCDRAKAREWRNQNLERARENARRWGAENRDWLRDYNREHYEQNREQRLEYAREYRAQNREKIREDARLYYKKTHERNYETYRERYLAKRYRRRALEEANLTQDDQDYIQILRRDPCAYCGAEGGEIDHIEPLSQGGTVDWTNLTAACRSCNRRKHTASLLDFLARQ